MMPGGFITSEDEDVLAYETSPRPLKSGYSSRLTVRSFEHPDCSNKRAVQSLWNSEDHESLTSRDPHFHAEAPPTGSNNVQPAREPQGSRNDPILIEDDILKIPKRSQNFRTGTTSERQAINIGCPDRPQNSPEDIQTYPQNFGDSVHTISNDDNSPQTPPRALTTSRPHFEKILAELLQGLTAKDGPGVIYMLKDLSLPSRGIKIGFTRRLETHKRINEHKDHCGIDAQVLHISPVDYKHCGKLEKIIKADLKPYCRPWMCHGCKTSGTLHAEYFDVDDTIALQTVRRWEAFMAREDPYGEDRELKPLWRHLLRKRKSAFCTASLSMHASPWQHWDAILSPPSPADLEELAPAQNAVLWRVCKDALSALWQFLRMYSWQTTSTVYAFLALVAHRNMPSLCGFAIVLVCAGGQAAIREFGGHAKTRVKCTS